MILRDKTEWRTVALIIGCYLTWLFLLIYLANFSPFLTTLLLIPVLTLHSSLQHECIHGHPFVRRRLNDLLIGLPLGLCIPFLRFKDLHLEHHQNASICDPFDDPESWYVSQNFWQHLPKPVKNLFQINNTLLGRMLLGPGISMVRMVIGDGQAIVRGDRRILLSWALHLLTGAVVIGLVLQLSALPLWAYLISCYVGYSLLMVRTYLEHQAEESVRGRSVIIEDRGPFSLLFLNNNLHAVHHAYPAVAWHQLPSLYRRHRERFLAMNKGYRFANYAEVFRRFAFRRKEPVVYPLPGSNPQ